MATTKAGVKAPKQKEGSEKQAVDDREGVQTNAELVKLKIISKEMVIIGSMKCGYGAIAYKSEKEAAALIKDKVAVRVY